MSQFFTLLTKTGQGLLANAIAYGEPLTIAELAIGDGGGKLPTPDATVTRLVNEVRRGPINQTAVDDDNPNWTVVEQVLPADVGGWTIREVGLYDTDGNLIAYGNYPETYKPQLSEGSARTQTIRFVMEVTDTSAVTLKIDPSVVMASRQYVDDQLDAHAKSRNHPDADTKNKGLLRFATLAESKKGEESKAAQTPAGGMAQIDDHRNETTAHNAEQIGLKSVLAVFGDAVKTVQGVLAALGSAAKLDVASDTDPIDDDGERVITNHTLKKWMSSASEKAAGILRIASQEETDNSDDDETAVTPKKLKNGFRYQFGTDGFIQCPSWLKGFMIQWGYLPSQSIRSAVWPTTFPNGAFGAAGIGADGTGAGGSHVLYDLTATGSSVSTSKAMRYIVIGR
ncbi:phage tail protein [Kushneria indalinina]|uniref:Tail-collar fiber protein n=1 Tax=Kushneria indalinina DSM 14324 TaxID=1122140 RepID=A0A3D9DW60_9GAMM|nr:phage tail protein [Kushneria indalinina]REC94885.1 tail-collar fiber protein [Kushneria indalinina DSM 14324]